jgi:hypothetical protein
MTKDKILKVLQQSAKKEIKNDGVHINIVFEKQADAVIELLNEHYRLFANYLTNEWNCPYVEDEIIKDYINNK